MKIQRLLIYIMTIMLFLSPCGCQKKQEDSATQAYEQIIKTLESKTTYDDIHDFAYKCTFTKNDDYYLYNLVINQPQTAMYNIVLVAYGADTIDDIHPSLGIFDEDSYALVPGHIDRQNGFYKGIALNGRVKQKESIKCYIAYASEANGEQITQHIFEVPYEN